jgi:hypothetical protein
VFDSAGRPTISPGDLGLKAHNPLGHGVWWIGGSV